ncbi:Ctr copper transporter family-domain-containing protein [Durotheca rogersii]|uniref:Ctr copper transporter family-domain-containing protein n=1 Tax=Durotheca rogersii TaxID=419775 RepID=UPI00221F3B04|nr:Ctr copper transporter family-domain-containing protein [Durotheca rogersii]KAI5862494.1 Ctr copper transporter family-domain-containing protein [Durotheca rogersii]
MDHGDDMTMTSTGAAASATGGMDMGTGAGGMEHATASMTMVFFRSATTPLYADAWTPRGEGDYAGTCVFLVALAVLHRGLIAARCALPDAAPARRAAAAAKADSDADDYAPALESAAARLRARWRARPFRVAAEAARALLELLIAGVGYLLMLAVMTMNVGYFLSVLGGIFLGTFLVGRFGSGDDHH